MSRMRARSDIAEPSAGATPSTTVTSAPRSSSASAAANPLTPSPATQHAQAGPVGVAVGERREPVGGAPAHPAPTTHSA